MFHRIVHIDLVCNDIHTKRSEIIKKKTRKFHNCSLNTFELDQA